MKNLRKQFKDLGINMDEFINGIPLTDDEILSENIDLNEDENEDLWKIKE